LAGTSWYIEYLTVLEKWGRHGAGNGYVDKGDADYILAGILWIYITPGDIIAGA
jgi:hypothetical protein